MGLKEDLNFTSIMPRQVSPVLGLENLKQSLYIAYVLLLPAAKDILFIHDVVIYKYTKIYCLFMLFTSSKLKDILYSILLDTAGSYKYVYIIINICFYENSASRITEENIFF